MSRFDDGGPRVETVLLEKPEVLGQTPPSESMRKGNILRATGTARGQSVFAFQARLDLRHRLSHFGVVAQKLIARVDAEYQDIRIRAHEGIHEVVQDPLARHFNAHFRRAIGRQIGRSLPLQPTVGNEHAIAIVCPVRDQLLCPGSV